MRTTRPPSRLFTAALVVAEDLAHGFARTLEDADRVPGLAPLAFARDEHRDAHHHHDDEHQQKGDALHWAHGWFTHFVSPEAVTSFFQIGAVCLSLSMTQPS